MKRSFVVIVLLLMLIYTGLISPLDKYSFQADPSSEQSLSSLEYLTDDKAVTFTPHSINQKGDGKGFFRIPSFPLFIDFKIPAFVFSALQLNYCREQVNFLYSVMFQSSYLDS